VCVYVLYIYYTYTSIHMCGYIHASVYIINTCVCVYIYIRKEIYYKELAHSEADKSQDLQGESASWRCRRANVMVPAQV